jgi:hypothetical protein
MQINYSFDYFITSYAQLWSLVFWLSYTLYCFVQLASYGKWYLSSCRRIKQGKDLIYRNIQQVRRFNSFLRASLIILTLIAAINLTYLYAFVDYSYVKGLMLAGFILLFVIAAVIVIKYYKAENHSRETNVVFTCVFGFLFAYVFMIFCFGCVIGGTLWGKPATQLVRTGNAFTTISHNPVPIAMEDFGIRGKGYRDSSAYHDETVFAARSSYTDNCFVNVLDKRIGIEYSVFSSSYPWIITHYFKMTKSRRYAAYRDIDGAAWGADKVYRQDKGNRILAVYKNKIMQFNADIAYSQEQISIIRKKLNLYLY